MYHEELISRACVLSDNCVYYLEYIVYTQCRTGEPPHYGLLVRQTGYRTAASRTGPLTGDKPEITALCELFARHFVFPSTLNDLVDDYRQTAI